MITEPITIKPISLHEWLPDRCLNGSKPFNPAAERPQFGCPSLNYFKRNNRDTLEQLYQLALGKYGCCGFIAWVNNQIVGYHNFFSSELAQKIKFYGFGMEPNSSPKTLIHNCLTVVKGDYLRKRIGSKLVKESLNWAKMHGWERFEVHLVLPDCEKGWQSDQKSCVTFWERFGFNIYKEYEADNDTQKYYGVTKRYSMYLTFDKK
jgi:GNAT superfamily N-acetyltransferase